jgi:hypothetical protein
MESTGTDAAVAMLLAMQVASLAVATSVPTRAGAGYVDSRRNATVMTAA